MVSVRDRRQQDMLSAVPGEEDRWLSSPSH